MFDLPYILTHPLLASIFKCCAELSEDAAQLPIGPVPRLEIERRIAQLEQYRLPKPTEQDLLDSGPIVNQWGQQIGERHSIRRRFVARRRGRPEEFTIKTRAALEDKLATPSVTWRQLADKYGFKDAHVLERAVRRLKVVLKREGIPLPQESDYKESAIKSGATPPPE